MTRCPGCGRKSCDGCRTLENLKTIKTSPLFFPWDFVPEKGRGLGIAFDVGTTTLAAMLWDLEEGRLLGVKSAMNPQRRYGADLVSRLREAERGEEQRRALQKDLSGSLDRLAKELLEENILQKQAESGEGGEDFPKEVKRVVFVGNTAMCELLLEIYPTGLLRAPFTPDYRELRCGKGSEFGFVCLRNVLLEVLPPVGGYVGADALAVFAAVNHEEKQQKILALDIGTNGEILFRGPNACIACSAAAGPALEGGAVMQGMGAARGAVDRITVGGRFPVQEILYHVIGEEEPAGICGSGLVDGLALLLQLGIADHSGYMRSREEARRAGVSERITKRIQENGKERRFLLTNPDAPVYLTQEDIRQLQLAIGAIRAGMETVLSKAGLRPQELDKIYLAGAFGSYINVESAVRVGLLPDLDRKRLVQAGNLAGAGASMALLSAKEKGRMLEAAAGITHVELAEEKEFQELFIKYMNFPQREAEEKKK